MSALRVLLFVLFLPILNCSSRDKNTLDVSTNSPTQETGQIPLEDFFRNPEITDFKISADGRWLAYRKSYKNRLNLFIRRVRYPTSEQRITSFDDRDVASYIWKGSQHLIFLKDKGGDENFHIYVSDIISSKVVDATPFGNVKAQIVDDLDQVDEENVLISHNKRDPKVFDLFRLHVPSVRLTLLEKNPGTFTSWMADHNGKVRWAEATDGANTSFYYRRSDKQPFRKILTKNFKESLNGLFFTFDNNRIFALSNLDRDKLSLVEFDPERKVESSILHQDSHFDLDGAEYSKSRKVLTFVHYQGQKPQRLFFDTETEKNYQTISQRLGDLHFNIVSQSADESVLVVNAFSDKNPGTYYLFKTKTGQLEFLADTRPWLKSAKLATMNPIEFSSRDGLNLQGYLITPPEYRKGLLPVVVNPHGGPWARDNWGYDPEAQFLANRGYAVLNVNFRGSTGFGKNFWTASFKQWGKKMQDDITDGVQWLIHKNIAAPKRICIYGGSYGGYATLAGLAFTPDLYRCGISYVGVSNIFTLMNTIPPYWEPMRQMLYEMVGHPEQEKELLTEASPLFHAHRIKAALFVAQGANDPRVKKQESDQIVEALRKRGVDVPYMVKDNEGHGFRLEENRMDFYRAMEKFLHKHLN